MTIDETLEFADKIYALSWELESNFFDWDIYNTFEQRSQIFESPVYRDCIHSLVHASDSLRKYALGFKEMQFAI